jgi:hypothetical protein
VDFFSDRVLAGWVRGPQAAEVSIGALLGDNRVAGAGIRDPQQPDLIRFRISLPRAVAAGDLASGKIVIEARTATESIVLDLWEPIMVAAELNNMNGVMLERVLGSLTAEKYSELATVFGASTKKPQPGTTVDASAYEDLMRWS